MICRLSEAVPRRFNAKSEGKAQKAHNGVRRDHVVGEFTADIVCFFTEAQRIHPTSLHYGGQSVRMPQRNYKMVGIIDLKGMFCALRIMLIFFCAFCA
jgi:hypothetical protein